MKTKFLFVIFASFISFGILFSNAGYAASCLSKSGNTYLYISNQTYDPLLLKSASATSGIKAKKYKGFKKYGSSEGIPANQIGELRACNELGGGGTSGSVEFALQPVGDSVTLDYNVNNLTNPCSPSNGNIVCPDHDIDGHGNLNCHCSYSPAP